MTYVDKYSGHHWDGGPSMEVIKARHLAVMRRKCCCGKEKDPSEVKGTGSRTWISCERCLGTIKNLS